MPSYEILISEQTLQKIKDYYQFLCANGIDKAGAHFKKQLELSDVPLQAMDLDTFTKLIIQSKIPKIFAESEVYHDQRDWTLLEESILGDISIHMPVSFFNDGGHHNSYKNHNTAISANLAYVPGALFRSDLGNTTADLEEVLVNGVFNQQRFNELYERRLLPQLVQIDSQARLKGKLAAVTIPGIGTNQFAGKNRPIIKNAFRCALEYVLEKHSAELSRIDVIHYDPYDGDAAQSKMIGNITFRVCPSRLVGTTGQLAYPEGTDPANYTLTSFVAWDHFSWPGNEAWLGMRATDDGVKAASTDTMAVITGIEGTYNPKTGSYEPPQGFGTWQNLVTAKNLNLSGSIFVVSSGGKKSPLKQTIAPVEQPKPVEPTLSYQKQSDEIDSALASFSKKINDIGSHHPAAKERAQVLLETLMIAKTIAFTDPNPKKLEAFKNKAVLNIQEATPMLQRDLGWGSYLSNLAKKIANVITTCLAQGFSLGNSKHHGFFTPQDSEAKKEAKQLEDTIKNTLKK